MTDASTPTPSSPDAVRDEDARAQLTGTDSGSDTRAGSLEGGSSSGSDDDPDQAAVNADLAAEGRRERDAGRASD